MAFALEKLLVYQKSVDFADSICQLTKAFPRGYGFLSDQLNRAALSIAANPGAPGLKATAVSPKVTARISSSSPEGQFRNACPCGTGFSSQVIAPY
jgi:hypothetical protein